MQENKIQPVNTKLIISVYSLLIVFIVLLLSMNLFGNESSVTSGDIDKLIQKKWDEKNIKPSANSTDEDFFRRVSIDLIGRIPTADETKAFIEDSSPNK